jgi:hypothetical protein
MQDFTLYQEALALKELGFDEAISTYYSFPDNKLSYVMDGHSKVSVRRNSQFGYAVSAPTYSEAFRFFREKHDLQHNIVWNKFYDKTPYQYEVRPTWRNEPLRPYGTSGMCSTYEEAELACLKKLIEIVKQK